MSIENVLSCIYAEWAGSTPEKVEALVAAGSNRSYYRLSGGGRTAVGAYGCDVAENRAFIGIARHLLRQGVSVPEIYAVSSDEHYYLVEDFGDTSLFSLLCQRSEIENLPLLEKVVEQLAHLQIKGANGFDFSQCYPVATFDRTSIFWDLNYFKYCFLKPQGVEIDEVKLEQEFSSFANHLLEADVCYFMYRDFQSRNIMVRNDGRLGFIDFQGGRRGPLQYDLVSFLFQAKAHFSDSLREQLLYYYLEIAGRLTKIDRDKFLHYYYSFVLFRTLQVLGAYGFRGLVERKPHFIESIPFALQNVRWLLNSGKLAAPNMPYLLPILDKLSESKCQLNPSCPCSTDIRDSGGPQEPSIPIEAPTQLSIVITSFSYKNGYPSDYSGNGGGYVFDCRGLNNPGRVPELRNYTGKDQCIIDFLEQQSAVERFLQPAFALVSLSVDNYLERKFTNLSVAFGCTGGQHRSVYCAERMAAYLKEKYPAVQVVIVHREQNGR